VYLLNQKLQNASSSIRFDDYVAGWKSFMSHPLIGSGFNNLDDIAEYMNLSVRKNYNILGAYYNTGIANGWTQIFPDGGILLSSIYLIAFISGELKRPSFLNRRQVTFILFVMMFTFSMSYSYLLILFMVMILVPKQDSLVEL